jgi:hypothetical protein
MQPEYSTVCDRVIKECELGVDRMGTDLMIQRRELEREARRIADEEEAKCLMKEQQDREIAEMQEVLLQKIKAREQAEAEEGRSTAGEGNGDGANGEEEEFEGEDEVMDDIDSVSLNDDQLRIPVSNLLLFDLITNNII